MRGARQNGAQAQAANRHAAALQELNVGAAGWCAWGLSCPGGAWHACGRSQCAPAATLRLVAPPCLHTPPTFTPHADVIDLSQRPGRRLRGGGGGCRHPRPSLQPQAAATASRTCCCKRSNIRRTQECTPAPQPTKHGGWRGCCVLASAMAPTRRTARADRPASPIWSSA